MIGRLLSELQAYEAHVRELTRKWDREPRVVVFGEAGRAMDRMRGLAAAHPQLSAQWLMLMISHAELMHNGWRAAKGEAVALDMEVRDHLACVSALQARCLELLVRGGTLLQ
ncbi:hypothetical protein HK414_08230 [Ramlibacter terrae]|uniref:Uncharacterized protein n=1 Tax=Ramlibacter terrae TaxID=2732511 RepID=A0ABX6P1K5_9BURK|nr:hypothetical protein HK414_08230 [Ramlibacter terrae]